MKHLAVLALALVGCSNATTDTGGEAFEGQSYTFLRSQGELELPETWEVHATDIVTPRCAFVIDVPGRFEAAPCEVASGLFFDVGPGVYWMEGEWLHVTASLRHEGDLREWGTLSFRGRRIP